MTAKHSEANADRGIKVRALDIGCSEHISFRWERLVPFLSYFGVDPLVREVERLQRLHPEFTFIDGYVHATGCKGTADFGASKFFNRSSAYADMKAGFDMVKSSFNHGQEVVYSRNYYNPEELAQAFGVDAFDIIKIDVDGDDYAILKGFMDSPHLSQELLAFEIEAQFHGDSGEYGNTFDNIMRLARERGFHIYKLDTFTYSRASKPKPYVHDFPSHTYGGQILWGDAVFIRDGIDETNSSRIRKIIKIYEAYDLDDCAFETLLHHSDSIGFSSHDFKRLSKSSRLKIDWRFKIFLRKMKRKVFSKIS